MEIFFFHLPTKQPGKTATTTTIYYTQFSQCENVKVIRKNPRNKLRMINMKIFWFPFTL
jgi:hypothetical protein